MIKRTLYFSSPAYLGKFAVLNIPAQNERFRKQLEASLS